MKLWIFTDKERKPFADGVIEFSTVSFLLFPPALLVISRAYSTMSFSPWTWIYALVKRVPDTAARVVAFLASRSLLVFPEMKRKRVHDVHPTVPLPREIVILTFPLPLCTRSSVPIPHASSLSSSSNLLRLCSSSSLLHTVNISRLRVPRARGTRCVKCGGVFVSCLVSTSLIIILYWLLVKRCSNDKW